MGLGIEKDEFDLKIETTYKKLEALLKRISGSSEEASIAAEALEELHVASSKLSRQNAELAAAQVAVKAERQRYQNLFDFAPDGYLVTDTNGVIREANRAAANLLHVSQERLVGKPLAVYVAEAERKAFRDILSTLLKRVISGANEWEIGLRPRTGKELRASLTVTPVIPLSATQQPAGNETIDGVGLRWSLRDITKSKQAEERERLLEESRQATQEAVETNQLLQTLLDTMPVGVTVCDPDGSIRMINPPGQKILGGSVTGNARNPERTFALLYPDGNPVPAGEAPMVRALEGKESVENLELLIRRADGSERTILAGSSPVLDSGGQVVSGVSIFQDITGLRQAEEQINSMARFPAENPNPVLRASPEGVLLYANEASQALLDEWHMSVGQPLPEFWKTIIADSQKEKKQLDVNSSERVYSFMVSLVPGEEYTNLYGRDITERKQAEDALRKNEADLRGILDATKESIWMFDPDGSILMGNETALRRLNRSTEEVIGQSFSKFMPAELAQLRQACLQKVVGTGQPAELEDERAGIVFHHSYYPVKDTDGRVVRVVSFSRDITERRKAEAEARRLLSTVQEEKDRLTTLVNNITDEVWFADTTKKFTLVNSAGLREFGMDPGNAVDVEKLAASLEVFRPDGSPRPIDEAPPLRALRGEIVKNLEEMIRIPTSGQIRYREVNAAPVRGPDGETIGAISVVRDITERKLAEEKMRQLNRTLRAISNTNQVMLRTSSESDFLDEVCEIIVKDCGHAMVWIGYKEQDEAKSVRPVASAGFEDGYLETLKVTWADSERGRGPTGTAIRTGKTSRCLNMLTDPKFAPWRAEALKRGYASSIVLPLMNEEQVFGAITIYAREPEAFSDEEEALLSELAGDLAYGILAIRMRTAHALAEEALKASEEKASNLVRYAPAAIYEIDFYGRKFLSVNETACEWSGYSQEELLRMNPMDFTDEDSQARFQERIRERLAGAEVEHSIEYRMIRKDGQELIMSINIGAFTYKDGKPESVLVVAHNITEHKRAEEALRQSEERYRTLFNGMTEGFALHEIICDEDGKPCDYRFLDINPAFERLTGLKRMEVIGKTHNEVLPDDSPKWVQAYGKVALTGEPVSFENYSPALKKHFEVSAYRPAERQFAVIFLDVSERKHMEDELLIAKAEAERRAVEFDAIFESMAETVVVYDASGRLVRANQAAVEMLGFDPHHKNVNGVVNRIVPHRADGQPVPQEQTPPGRALRGERVTGEHFTITNGQGRTLHTLGSAAPFHVGGRLAGAVTVWQDVTEIMEMEQSLRESEQRFRLALRNAPVTVATQDRDLRFTWAYNQRTVDPNQVIGKRDADLFPPEDAARLVALKRKVLETEKELSEQLWVRSGGQQLFLDLFIEPLRDASGQVTGIGIATVDLTPMKLAEQAMSEARDVLDVRVQERTRELVAANQQLENEIAERIRSDVALHESETRYRTLFETSPDTVIMVNMENKILFANQRAAEMHGYRTAKNLVGKDFFELVSPEGKESLRESILKTMQHGPLREIEYQILKKDGSSFPAELNVTMIFEGKGEPTGFLLDIRDITERKWAEQSIRLANAYNRSLIETSLDALVTITPDGKIGDVNTATEKVTGYSRAELIGTDFHNYFSDPFKARLGYQKVFENGSVRDYDLEIRHKDGSITPVLYNASIFRDEGGNVLGAFAIARDITDRKQFETQLVQAEKHAVIGRMVGSITHEINNPLQTIKNCLYLIQQDVTPESPIHEPLEMVTSETLRLTNLVGQLRELYRPKAGLNKQSQELLDILEEAHALLIPHLNNARVEWQPMAGLQRCYINCVRDQILEVFLNISVNAIEAMQHHGGKLFVDMKVSDEWATVIFKDTGPGIPKEILPRLFEPFMTSKASGLGLGLSITYGIIQRHGGQIQVENQPGQGATFTILLPLHSQGGDEENGNADE